MPGIDAYPAVHIFTLQYGASGAHPCWYRPGVVEGACLHPGPNQVVYRQPIGSVSQFNYLRRFPFWRKFSQLAWR